MATTINTNLASLLAQRHLSSTQNGLATTMQRLSSGLRVNSAKDDAAGLAISERMNTQVRGLAVAARNVNDGISLAQVAEGAMQRLTDILQRSRELAVQAANGTNSPSDRLSLDREREQLAKEFSRIVSTSNFNGQKLIDGSFVSQSFQVGVNAGETIGLGLPSLQAPDVGAYGWRSSSTDTHAILPGNGETMLAGDLVLNGSPILITSNESSASIAEKVNAAPIDPKIFAQAMTIVVLTLELQPTDPPVPVTLKLIAGDDLSRAQSVSFVWDPANDGSHAMTAINAVSTQTGVRAVTVPGENFFRLVNDEGETIRVLNESGNAVNITLGNFDGAAFTDLRRVPGSGGGGAFGTGVNDLKVQGALTLVGEDGFTIDGGGWDVNGDPTGPFPTMTPHQISRYPVSEAHLRTAASARKALVIYDAAINQISAARAHIGATQSGFEAVVDSIGVASENLAVARGRIVDADYAVETAQLARVQILQNAGTAMVAQANSAISDQALALLKDV
jgi:flagellin